MRSHAKLALVALFSGVLFVVQAGLPGNGLRAQNPKMVDDAAVTPIQLEAKGLVPVLIWADSTGKSFFALEGDKGILKRVSVPDGKTVMQKDLGRKAGWLSVSAEGLLVSLPDKGEVWVVNPENLEVKKKIDVPKMKRAVSAESLSVAATGSVDGNELSVVDLKTGKADKFVFQKKQYVRGSAIDPAMTPDGKYLFTQTAIGRILKFSVANGNLTFEEEGPRLHAGTGLGFNISPDSKLICQPTGSGNPDLGKNYSIRVMTTAALTKTEVVLEPGAHPKPVGFDPAAQMIYTGNTSTPLIVFTYGGVKKKDYKLGKGDARAFLVHPEGSKFVFVQNDSVSWVELPKP